MKTILITLLIAALAPALSALPSGLPLSVADIGRAIGNGNVEQLTQFMDAEVELSILEEEDLYSRSEAATRLRQFFAKFGPKAFNQVHQGSSKAADAEYVIGNLATERGNLRVYIYVAKRGDRVVLQELRFDREA